MPGILLGTQDLSMGKRDGRLFPPGAMFWRGTPQTIPYMCLILNIRLYGMSGVVSGMGEEISRDKWSECWGMEVNKI